MNKIIRLGIISIFIFSGLSCTAHISPNDFNVEGVSLPSLQNIKPIAIKAKLTGSKDRELPLAGTDIIINEDDFTKVVVKQLTETLQSKNISVVPEAKRSIEIQVVHISLQPDRTIYCVIDFNRKLGDGDFYGFQSRSKDWNFNTACEDALKNTVNDILNNVDTIKYLKGE